MYVQRPGCRYGPGPVNHWALNHTQGTGPTWCSMPEGSRGPSRREGSPVWVMPAAYPPPLQTFQFGMSLSRILHAYSTTRHHLGSASRTRSGESCYFPTRFALCPNWGYQQPQSPFHQTEGVEGVHVVGDHLWMHFKRAAKLVSAMTQQGECKNFPSAYLGHGFLATLYLLYKSLA